MGRFAFTPRPLAGNFVAQSQPAHPSSPMSSTRRHSSSSAALSIPAEGLRHGSPVTVCRNLYASFKGAPLTLMPSLQLPSLSSAAHPAADFFPGVYPALRFRAVDAGELFTTVGSFHSTSGDVAAVQPLSLKRTPATPAPSSPHIRHWWLPLPQVPSASSLCLPATGCSTMPGARCSSPYPQPSLSPPDGSSHRRRRLM